MVFTSSYFTDSTHCRWEYDSKAFLFSLVNQPGWAPVKLNPSGSYSLSQYSVYICSSYGPTFGGGHDIYIANNAAYSSSSYSYHYTYGPPSGYGYGPSSFLAGSSYFTPDEIETFFIPKGEILLPFIYLFIIYYFTFNFNTYFLRTTKFSLKYSMLFHQKPLYLVKVFSLETLLIWTVIVRSKLIPLVPDWHHFYGVKG